MIPNEVIVGFFAMITGLGVAGLNVSPQRKVDKKIDGVVASLKKLDIRVERIEYHVTNEEDTQKIMARFTEIQDYYLGSAPEKYKVIAKLKSDIFINLMDYSMKLNFDNVRGFALFKARCLACHEEARKMVIEKQGEDFCKQFYKIHDVHTRKWIDNIRDIFFDAMNGKRLRFINAAILFMQNFMEHVCKADYGKNIFDSSAHICKFAKGK
jgi:hypothetical protein